MVAPVIAAAAIQGLASAAGSAADYFGGQSAADKAWKREKKVLQNQVQWRTQDAIKAGIHPLAALGLNPASGPAAAMGPDFSRVGSELGANLGRAAEAAMTPADKMAARMQLAQVETQEANRDLARAQLAGAQKALLTHGATPGVASNIPKPPSGVKADRLSAGGGEFWRDASGSVHRLPGAVDSQWLEDKTGESVGDIAGAHRSFYGWLSDMGAKGVWPGVLGF